MEDKYKLSVSGDIVSMSKDTLITFLGGEKNLDASFIKFMRENNAVGMYLLVQLGVDLKTLNRNEYDRALWQVAADGSTAVLKALHDLGADLFILNRGDETLAHSAAFMGRSQTLALLRDFGLDLDQPDEDGQRPVHILLESRNACMRQAESLKILIEAGVDLEAPNDKGENPAQLLLNASMLDSEKAECLKMMIERGINLAARDKDGNSYLHLAASKADPLTFQLLLDHGADPWAVNYAGETPLEKMMPGLKGDFSPTIYEYRAAIAVALWDLAEKKAYQDGHMPARPLGKSLSLGMAPNIRRSP